MQLSPTNFFDIRIGSQLSTLDRKVRNVVPSMRGSVPTLNSVISRLEYASSSSVHCPRRSRDMGEALMRRSGGMIPSSIAALIPAASTWLMPIVGGGSLPELRLSHKIPLISHKSLRKYQFTKMRRGEIKRWACTMLWELYLCVRRLTTRTSFAIFDLIWV